MPGRSTSSKRWPAMLQVADLFFDRHAGIVAGPLAHAGQRAEQRRLARVRVADQGDRQRRVGDTVGHDRIQAASNKGGRSIRLGPTAARTKSSPRSGYASTGTIAARSRRERPRSAHAQAIAANLQLQRTAPRSRAHEFHLGPRRQAHFQQPQADVVGALHPHDPAAAADANSASRFKPALPAGPAPAAIRRPESKASARPDERCRGCRSAPSRPACRRADRVLPSDGSARAARAVDRPMPCGQFGANFRGIRSGMIDRAGMIDEEGPPQEYPLTVATETHSQRRPLILIGYPGRLQLNPISQPGYLVQLNICPAARPSTRRR